MRIRQLNSKSGIRLVRSDTSLWPRCIIGTQTVPSLFMISHNRFVYRLSSHSTHNLTLFFRRHHLIRRNRGSRSYSVKRTRISSSPWLEINWIWLSRTPTSVLLRLLMRRHTPRKPVSSSLKLLQRQPPTSKSYSPPSRRSCRWIRLDQETCEPTRDLVELISDQRLLPPRELTVAAVN